MGTTPSVLDQAIARTLGTGQSAAPASTAPAPSTGGDVLDGAISRALGQKAPATPPPTPEQARSRTLSNMTLAMSGQQDQMAPEDKAEFESGRKAGMASAAVTAATTGIGDLLLAPSAVTALSKVPAGRDPVTGQMLPWVVKAATEEGSSLAKAGYDALKAAGEAHPLVKQMIISGLGAMGAGKIAHALGWIGKAAEP